VTFLDGISPEYFLADVFLLQSEGRVSRRLGLTFSAGFSNGAQPVGLLTGRYDTFALAAEASFMVSRPWAFTISYNRSDYRLFGFPPPPDGPSPQFDRNAIRLGMTYVFTLTSRAGRSTRPGRTED
jgi:hypothetical protein